MNRRKLIGVVASVLVALGGTLVILRSSNSAKPVAVAPAEPAVTVLKVVKPVPKGTPSDKLGDAVQEVSVPASQKSAGAAASLADLTGLVVSTDLVPDEQVMKARFITAQEQQRTEVAASGGTGLMGVWISLDPLRALGGQIQAGDQVAVIASFVDVASNAEATELTVPATAILLHKVPVLEVRGGAVPSAPAPEGAAPTTTTVAPIAPISIKLGLTAGESERLIFALNNGTLWLADEANDVPENGTKIVQRDNVYAKTLRRYELLPLATSPAASASAGSARPNAVNTDPFAAGVNTTVPVAGDTTNAATSGTSVARGATPATKALISGARTAKVVAGATPAPGAASPATAKPTPAPQSLASGANAPTAAPARGGQS